MGIRSRMIREGQEHDLDVLHILWKGGGGGAERHVMNLVLGMRSLGVRGAVLLLSDPCGAAIELEAGGVTHRCCGLQSGYDPRGPIRVARHVRDLRPKIIHDHVSPPWLCALVPRSPGSRLVRTEHGHLLRAPFAGEGPRLWVERAGSRRTDLYIVPSESIAEAVVRLYRYPRERIRVIPHGIDPTPFPVRPSLRAEVRAEIGLGPDRVGLFFVGRFETTKGIPELWDAYCEAARLDARLDLVGIGEGPLRDLLEEQATRAGLKRRVHLLGFRKDVDRLLLAADLFVLPSRSEAFGIVLIEAMRTGLPVLATRTGGIPEIVRHEKTGILVPPQDPRSLAAAMVMLARDEGKREALGRAGRERWAEAFTSDRMTRATKEAYDSVGDAAPAGMRVQ